MPTIGRTSQRYSKVTMSMTSEQPEQRQQDRVLARVVEVIGQPPADARQACPWTAWCSASRASVASAAARRAAAPRSASGMPAQALCRPAAAARGLGSRTSPSSAGSDALRHGEQFTNVGGDVRAGSCADAASDRSTMNGDRCARSRRMPRGVLARSARESREPAGTDDLGDGEQTRPARPSSSAPQRRDADRRLP